MHLRLGDFNQWTEEEKISFLSKEFNSKRPLVSKNMKFDRNIKNFVGLLEKKYFMFLDWVYII